MRLKVKNTEKYPGYKVCSVDRGERAHELAFLEFLTSKMRLPVKSLPRHADKKYGAWLSQDHMFPPVRGYAKLLIPEPKKYPCDVCQFARYNSQCRLQASCVPYFYYIMMSVEQMADCEFGVPSDKRKKDRPARQRKGAGSSNDSNIPRKRTARKGKAGKGKAGKGKAGKLRR